MGQEGKVSFLDKELIWVLEDFKNEFYHTPDDSSLTYSALLDQYESWFFISHELYMELSSSDKGT